MPKQPLPEDEAEHMDHVHDAGFERIRRTTGKTQNAKAGRRQQDKAWGKMINRFQKQRKRYGDDKP